MSDLSKKKKMEQEILGKIVVEAIQVHIFLVVIVIKNLLQAIMLKKRKEKKNMLALIVIKIFLIVLNVLKNVEREVTFEVKKLEKANFFVREIV